MANHKGPPGSSGSPEPFESDPLDEDLEQFAKIPDSAERIDMPEAQLSDDLRRLYQPEARANARSLSSVYTRLQAIERTRPPMLPSEGNLMPFLSPPTSPKGSHTMKTVKTPGADTAPVLHRSAPLAPSRLASVAAVLATALLLTGALWGFLYFHAQRSTGPTQLTATLRCTSAPFATDSSLVEIYNRGQDFVQPMLDWSARGDISFAIPTAFFSGNTCASLPLAQAAEKSLDSGYVSQVVWSPDGRRLLPLAQSASVLDATTGRILVSLQMSTNIGWGLPTTGRAVWTADGTQIVGLTPTTINTTTDTVSEQVKVWNSQTGALIRTALSLTNVLFGGWISPNGAYVAALTSNHSIQFWNIATGQLVSATPPTVTGWFGTGTVAWSPDGSLFAYGIGGSNPPETPGQVQIVSSSTGQLVATLTDADTFAGVILGLAWSPNGKYLAETSGQINIWDTSTWQRVATFGTDATGAPFTNRILTVAWSPDGSMLAGVAGPRLRGIPGFSLRLEIWKLS
jgi:hypothetical protein